MPKSPQPSQESPSREAPPRPVAVERRPQRHDYAAGADGDEAVDAAGAGADEAVDTANRMLDSTSSANRILSPHSDDVEGAPGRPLTDKR